MWLTALVLRFAPVSASPKLRKALTAACLLRGIGYLLEGVTHVAFNQRDGLALALSGRAVVMVSLFLGRPLGYFNFSLTGLERTLLTNIFQRL